MEAITRQVQDRQAFMIIKYNSYLLDAKMCGLSVYTDDEEINAEIAMAVYEISA